MAQLIVRNLDDHLKAKIQMQAHRKGISMEEMVRQILARYIGKKTYHTANTIASYFEAIDADFEAPEFKGQSVKLSEFDE